MFVRSAPPDRRLFVALLGALVALAWAVLWLWDQSPYARFLDHRELTGIEIAPDAGALVFAAAFVSGWTLMVFAMMLPTSAPLISLFHRMTARRPDRARLMVLLIGGYIAVWALFGVAAHSSDWFLHRVVVENVGWLNDNVWVIPAVTLILAGVYQFTPLKYHCLDKCRSPFTFITEHWTGRDQAASSFRLGAHHGVFCVGCCWSLMLVMFAVGIGNFGWMLLLGAVMTVEKNMTWGRRLSAPLGVGLIAAGLLVVAFPGGGACGC